ncbi:MAG: undecaprenyl-diphosphatase UppP [Candidatus Woykebacteria bacterium]
MEIFQAAVLGIVQGLTEFLPISSSGHLILVPAVFGWSDFSNNLTFDVALHVGTTFAVVLFFWKDWLQMVGSFVKNLPYPNKVLADFNSKFFLMILVGSIPAAIVGLNFQDLIEEKIRSSQIVAIMLISFALLLFAADRVGAKKRTLDNLGFLDSVVVGIAQAVSLIPGVSRSGITITAGLFRGINRESATRFSFLLSTPAIAGAAALRFKDFLEVGVANQGAGVFLVGFLTSAVTGWIAIKFLLKYIANNNYNIFVWYRLIVGIGILIWFFR